MVHTQSMIKQRGPLIRHSCFAFEATHNFFKQTARKQNFKNLTKSLAERCQKNECSNFVESNNPQSHPLFLTERQYSVLTPISEFGKKSLRLKLDRFKMLPGIELENAFESSWVLCYGTRFRENYWIQ